MSELIELNNIQKSYKKMMALRGVSLRMSDGITGLLGPNGAGKSTLIKVLMGLVKVNSGSGSVLGFELGKQDRKIRSLVGYMPEDDCYIAGMTGIEMVTFSASLAGIPAVEGLRRAHEIMDFCGVHQERYRSVEGYSTGMRQKTKFAAAIVHDPLLLILDEPTSGLDPEEREALLNRVRVLCERFNKSAIVSTHILPDVQAICDNVIILAEGEVRVSDSLKALNKPTSPKYIAAPLLLDDGKQLADLLNRAGIATEFNREGLLSIEVREDSTFATISGICSENKIVLKSLTPARNSIEEIFMAAIKGSNAAENDLNVAKGAADANS